MIRLFALVTALLAASPALAQLTATYVSGDNFEMRIEISPNGDMRGTMPGKKTEFMTIGGVGYLIDGSGGAPKVYRATDIAIAVADQVKDLPPDLQSAMKGVPAMVLEEGDIVTINGRTGKAYYFHAEGAARSTRPEVVISSDASLAPLGVAMAGQFEMSMSMTPPAMAPLFARMKPMGDALHLGAPLRFGPAELRDVSTAPIPPARFVLPAAPLSLNQVRAQMTANGGHLP